MQPKIYSVSDHDIDLNSIDPDALYVLNKLREAGHIAYLVGGGVRDLLLKKTPKDFDISTSALPEQIKRLFQRRCLLIGRRFLLAHVRFGHKVLEVSTFRTGENDSDLITRDNEWGTPEQDVLRRDFTINGLFYDPATHSVIDYVGGWQDIHDHVLRTIGDPEVRFKQDPVRMIRLLKFRARFGFKIMPIVRSALINCREEILKSSPARLMEEILRMLESGASAPFFNLLLESGLLDLIYPELTHFIQTKAGKETFLYLSGVDKINQQMKKMPLDRPVLFACLLFPMMQQSLKEEFVDNGQIPNLGQVIMATSSSIMKFHTGAFALLPRRLAAVMGAVLTFQYRLTPFSGKKHYPPKLLRSKDFVYALQFLKIRAMVDKDLIETYTSWKAHYLQHAQQSERHGHQVHSPAYRQGRSTARKPQHVES